MCQALILGFSIVLAPATALSFSIKGCEGLPVGSVHIIETKHRVIGKGVVAYSDAGGFCESSFGCSSFENLKISACASGQTLNIAKKLSGDDVYELFDRSVEVDEILQMLVAAKKPYSLNGVKSAFEQQGISIDSKVQTAENCACSATFPALRYGKKRFEGF